MMNPSRKTQDDWIYLNHCIEDRDVGAVKQFFEPGNDGCAARIQLFTNVRSPISLAAVAGEEEVIEILVQHGFDPQSPDLLDGVYQRRPVHLAVSAGHVPLVKTLLTKFRVNVDDRDDTGRTPLHWAACMGHTELAKVLLSRGSCVNAVQKDMSTPLHYAAEASHGGVCKILMANNADVNLKDNKGFSPLHYAVRSQPSPANIPSGAVANHESLC